MSRFEQMVARAARVLQELPEGHQQMLNVATTFTFDEMCRFNDIRVHAETSYTITAEESAELRGYIGNVHHMNALSLAERLAILRWVSEIVELLRAAVTN